MLEAMAHFNLDAFTHFFQADEVMGPYSRPSVSQSYVLQCADGKWIALHMSSPEKFWQGLATAIEQPDLFQDPRFATREAAHREPGDADRAARRASSSAARATTGAPGCKALDVPHAPMYDTSEALLDPQALHLQLTAPGHASADGPVPHRALAGVLRRPACARRAAAAHAGRTQPRDPPGTGPAGQPHPTRRQRHEQAPRVPPRRAACRAARPSAAWPSRRPPAARRSASAARWR